MIRKTITLFFIFSSVFFISLSAKDVPSIYKDSKNSIVLILASDGKTISQGTGFYFMKNLIATNFHIIEGASWIYIKNIASGKVFRAYRIKKYSKKLDIAIIEVDEYSQALPLGNDQKQKIGEDIIAIGNPEGLEGSISTGIISGIRLLSKFSQYYIYQVTAPISQGSSGGPVLNSHGEVIGIATFSRKRGQNLNFAMPASLLKKLENNQIEGSTKELIPYKKPIVIPTVSNNENWYVILGSFSKEGFDDANSMIHILAKKNYNAHLINTDNYSNLRNNLWAVVMGPYTKSHAEEIKNNVRSIVPDAYIKSKK